MALQLLHVFWSCLILRMIYSFVKKGRVGPGRGGRHVPPCGPSPALPTPHAPPPIPQMEKDVRSDVEESDSSDGEVAQEHLLLKNGAAHRPGAAPADGPRSRLVGRVANGHTATT